jgi:multisubunit Na+/H+ antiporter MnhB subunit
MGTLTILMAQAGKVPNIDPAEAAYYAAQPMWLAVAVDIALISAVVAAVALLLRSRAAVWFFAISVVAIFATNLYDIAVATSRMLVDRGAVIMTVTIAVLAILQLFYALAMKRRDVLK